MKIKWILLPIAAMTMLAACNVPGGNTSSQQVAYDPATSVTIDETSVPEKVYAGESFTITATVLPETANPKVTWTSSNSSVATVDENGLFTAINAGFTTVKATTENGLKANKQIIVTEYVPVETFNVAKQAVTIAANGGFHYMDVAITPADATEKGATFASSNTSVATVDENGIVTAHNAGSALITATSKADSSKTATTAVTVTTQSWDNKRVVDVTADNKVDLPAFGNPTKPISAISLRRKTTVLSSPGNPSFA